MIFENQKKKLCELCQSDSYERKYALHLKNQHKDIWQTRQLIKNAIKLFTKEELEKVKVLVLDIKKVH